MRLLFRGLQNHTTQRFFRPLYVVSTPCNRPQIACMSSVIESPARDKASSVSTSATERKRQEEEQQRRREEEKRQQEEDGHSDWFYVLWGGLALAFIGGPAFAVYQIRNDRETRDWTEEHCPFLIRTLQPYLDLYPELDPNYRDVERYNEVVVLAQTHTQNEVVGNAAEEVLEVQVSNQDRHELKANPDETLNEIAKRVGAQKEEELTNVTVKDQEKNPHMKPISPLAIHFVNQTQIDQMQRSLEQVKQAKEKLREDYLNGKLSKIDHAMARDLSYKYEKEREALEIQLKQMRYQLRSQQQQGQSKSFLRRMLGL